MRVHIECDSGRIAVRITNSGEWKPKAGADPGTGIGLANVRRRLELCYGEESDVGVIVANGFTTVRFTIPTKQALAVAATA